MKKTKRRPTIASKKATRRPLRSTRSMKAKTVVVQKTKSRVTRVKTATIPKPTPKPLTREMLEIRQRLTSMLQKARHDIAHEVKGASERDLAHINDTSDMAADAAEGDLALRIAESETVEAGEIERAIQKVDDGTYGTCENCGAEINTERLHFLPYVTLCIKCQGLSEIRKREEGDDDELEDLAETSESESEG